MGVGAGGTNDLGDIEDDDDEWNEVDVLDEGVVFAAKEIEDDCNEGTYNADDDSKVEEGWLEESHDPRGDRDNCDLDEDYGEGSHSMGIGEFLQTHIHLRVQ
jgi:hypothetical protein